MTADKKVRSTLTVQSVLTTSDKSYARKISDKEDTQDLEKKDSDQAGPFSVAMTAEDKYAENTKGEGHATKILRLVPLPLWMCQTAVMAQQQVLSVPRWQSSTITVQF